MNKKFFGAMQSIAVILLVIGIVATVVLAFTVIVVEVEKAGITNNYTVQQFNPTGLATTLASLLGTVAVYYIVKGIALIGLKIYENEAVYKDDEEDEQIEKISKSPRGVSLLINTQKDISIKSIFQTLQKAKYEDVYVFKTKDSETVCVECNGEVYFNVENGELSIINYSSTIDIGKLLDIVMPLADNKFSGAGEHIIEQLKSQNKEEATVKYNDIKYTIIPD